MEANAGYFSEQVTGVDSRGSLPLRYLCDNVKEHCSKLSHLQERKLGHSSRNCNLLLVKSCCCCSQVPALQACPAWGPDKPEKVLGEKITGAFMREPLSWQHENSEYRGRGQSRVPSVALLFFYVCSSLLICKLLQNRDVDYFRFPRHGAWNRMALHKYYLSERRNMKTYTLLHWFHSKVGRSRKEAIFNWNLEMTEDIEDVWVGRGLFRRQALVWICMLYWKVYWSWSTLRFRLSRNITVVSDHGQMLLPLWDSVPSAAYLLHRDVKIIKGDNRFESTSKKKYSYRESNYLTVENVMFKLKLFISA